MAGNRVPKVREDDWVSVQKAIRRLNAAASGDTNVTYRIVTVTNNIVGSGGQIEGFTIQKVADAAARLAIPFITGKMCFQIDEGCFYGATTL